ncbi:EamA family transporter [Flavobacterium cerinum]|uniref:DMT family transporter n=1 Tax=Flavobacterium cerinum TaxID=2502784 RepID=A0ABY5IW93_9FLAO|nr:DMT family transporter [Flavobacterium cerinum]UUC47085.1 DMT family transporter [Flavobacterium cerinum]
MLKYIIIVILGAISYGMLASFAKIAYKEGYNAGEITLAQAFLGALLLWGAVIFRSIKKKTFRIVEGWKLLLAGTSIGVTTYIYYLSVSYIPASLAIVLLMQITWIGNVVEWLVFKKRLSPTTIFATVFIIIGTILAGNLSAVKQADLSVIGILLGLLSAVIYSISIIFTSKLGKETPVFEKSALMMSGSAMIIFVINLQSITTSNHLDFGLLQWGLFLAVFGTVIPPVCFSIGMPKIGAGLSSILLTLELPVAVFCAHILLCENITFVQLFGIIVMLSAITYLNLVNFRKSKTIKSNHNPH